MDQRSRRVAREWCLGEEGKMVGVNAWYVYTHRVIMRIVKAGVATLVLHAK